MKERKIKGIEINFSRRWIYTFILLGIIFILGGAYALTAGIAPNPGHLLTSFSAPTGCVSGEILEWTGTEFVCSSQATSPIPTQISVTSFTSQGNMGGYDGMNSLIQSSCPGYHVCTDQEVALYLGEGNTLPSFSFEAWVASGTISYQNANYEGEPQEEVNDCKGWTTSVYDDSSYYYNLGSVVYSSGSFAIRSCYDSNKILCCK